MGNNLINDSFNLKYSEIVLEKLNKLNIDITRLKRDENVWDLAQHCHMYGFKYTTLEGIVLDLEIIY